MSPAVYLAAPLAHAAACRLVAMTLRAIGADVCSTWHATTETVDPTDVPTREAILQANLADMDRAEIVVALLHEGTPRGALVEVGYALAMGIAVVWVQGPNGEGANIFDCHSRVKIVRSVGDAVRIVRDVWAPARAALATGEDHV